MAAKAKNPVWTFLASVQLALLLIGLLASTSIIGTIIQQNQPAAHYTEKWPRAASVIQALNLNDMYNSAWFLALLGAFSLNLTVCSIDRLPGVIRLVRKDNLETDPSQLLKMKMQRSVQVSAPVSIAAEQVVAHLARRGRLSDWLASRGFKIAALILSKAWKTNARVKDNGILLFAQKGGWTRYGVYAVHISILIILLGAVIGSPTVAKKLLKNQNFAFKGGVSLPETRSTDRVFAYDDEREIPLGFTVRCNFFDIDFYDNGMPKDYVSSLTVLENGKEVLTTKIEVNKPLKHKGVTFYQSSYNDIHSPIIHLTNLKTGKTMVFPVDPKQWDATHSWQEEGGGQGMLRIQDVQSVPSSSGEGMTTEMKIWLMDSQGPPSMFDLSYGRPVIVERPGVKYELKIGPHYATGLQVSKDPGVLWVYGGCALMLLGLYAAFFMSHRKMWAYIREEDGRSAVTFIGQSNKNSLSFEKTFAAVTEGFGTA